MSIQSFEVILYVADQNRSRDFYAAVLDFSPSLDVLGMTEFSIGAITLGLMPERGIRRLLGDTMRDPADAAGIPRCELYLTVDNPSVYSDRAIMAGARMLSPLAARDWGQQVVYLEDLDAHIIAFASARDA